MSEPRVVIAHDYLTQRGGAERVVLALARTFPDAPIYTTLYDPSTTYPEFAAHTVVTSPLNRVRYLRRHHRSALPLLPLASERLRIPDADVVVASSSGWAHSFPTDAARLVYCHSPARWLYQSKDYLGDARSSIAAVLAMLTPLLVRRDKRAALSADRYLAHSAVIAERINRVYGLEAPVVFPPGGMPAEGEPQQIDEVAQWAPEGFLLVVSRLLAYKNVAAAISAVAGREEKLLIVGAGPLEAQLTAMAPPNVRILSNIGDAQLRWAYATCRALLAPSYEDFGLTPLEAGAFGKPVAALRGGGYLDTVQEGRTGVFFDEPEPQAIAAAITELNQREWAGEQIRAHAATFGEKRFAAAIRAHVDDLWQARTS